MTQGDLQPLALSAISAGAQSLGGVGQSGSGNSATSSSTTPSSAGGTSAGSNAASGGQAVSQEQLLRLNDGEVVNFLNHVNQQEIQMAQMASGKLQTQQVIDMNREIVNDHQNALAQVQDAANSANAVQFRYQPATYELAQINGLSQLQGATFEQAYAQAQQLNHQAAIQKLQQYQSANLSPAVQQLVSALLPELQQHLANAQSAATTLAAATPAASPSPSPTASPSPSASPSGESNHNTNGGGSASNGTGSASAGSSGQ